MSAIDHHADPLRDATAHGLERAVRLTSIAAASIQVLAQITAQRKREEADRARHQARAVREHRRAVHQATRLQWAPALDRQWLRTADFLKVARAWGAAVSYVDSDPSAADALKRCETRLRQLHPHGMSHYDRFREQGLGPAKAMREAAGFFARDPNVRTGYPAPVRAALLSAKESPSAADAAQLAQGDFPQTISTTVQTTPEHKPAQSTSPTKPVQRSGRNPVP